MHYHRLLVALSLHARNCSAFSVTPTTDRWDSRKSSTHGETLPRRNPAHLPATELSATGPNFCEQCGTPTVRRVPNGDERERSCCSDPTCGFVSYQNPKVVVGAICTFGNKILLCKRAIEPCAGKWGYPQGFMELGETSREGAVRETLEESGAVVDVVDDAVNVKLLAVYNLAGAQVQLVYVAPLVSDKVELGIESEDVGFFDWDEIPWDELAFPTVHWALEYARDNLLPTGELPNDLVPQQRSKVYLDGTWSLVEEA